MPDHPPDLTARTPDPDVTTRRGDSLPPVVLPHPTGGRYVLGAEIARGGMGAVFRATDTALGREVAVKLLQERFGPDSGTARRFADEARIAGQLQHPGIPPVHEFGTFPDGRPFLAMKLIKGDTLDDLLRARRDPTDDRGRFVAVFETVCQAVGYAHAHDVIHRDLKPANVMVGAFGEVQVMDWGLAKVLRPGAAADGTVADANATAPNTEVRSLRDSDDERTQAGAVMGTPAYMPPEQAAGAAHKVTPRSDVFGLGAVLAVILTGRPPFEAVSAETVRVKAAQGDVADCLSRLDACGAEPELVALCKRCLSPRPADRPATAGAVAEAVADFRAQAEARARQAELDRVKAEGERATAEAKAAEQRRRKRVQLWLAGAVVLLLAGAGGVAVWRAVEDGNKRTETARLEVEERERRARAADAVAALLDLTRAGLEAGDAARASPFLDQADRHAADGAVADHADRRIAYRCDLELLRDLDAVDTFRWTPVGSDYPPHEKAAGWITVGSGYPGYPHYEKVAERWQAALAGHGIGPGATPAESAARINRSPIRATLVAALDAWLALLPAEWVRATLDAADPDPFRAEVRRRLATRDVAGLAELLDHPGWAAQPAGLVAAYATSPAVRTAVARGLLSRTVAARPGDFGLLMHLGGTYSFNTPDEAADSARWFQAAVAVRVGNVAAHLNLGNALYVKRDLDAAAAAYREAIRLDPKYAPAHIGLGNVLYLKGDPDAAAAAYRKAIRLDPKNAPPNDLGNFLPVKDRIHVKGRSDGHALRPAAAPHIGLGNALYVKRDLDAAAAAYREAIRLDPWHTHPHLSLGNVLSDKGDLDAAAAAYREAIRLDPKYAPAHNGLGNVLRGKRDLDAAVAAYREAIRLDPKYAPAHNGLGLGLAARGNLDAAVAAYREAIRLDPRHAPAHGNLGNLLYKQGDLDAAVAAYREVIRLDPKNANPHVGLGLVCASRLELGQAEIAYREAIRLDPQNKYALTNLGDVCRKQGRLDDAIAAYRAALAIQPTLGYTREGLNYCERVLRGAVPTAPAPRAVGR